MPKAEFYAGLPLAEQLEKLVDHHYDRAVRHISQDEAAILETAVARLKAGVPKAQRVAEFSQAWQRLEHRYQTTIWSADSDYQVVATTVPTRGSPLPASAEDLLPADSVIAEVTATTRFVQLGVNVVFRHAMDQTVDVAEVWNEFAGRRSPPEDASLGSPENELLNRVLYQPTIAVEQSPPTFTSLTDVLGKAAGTAWMAIIADTTHRPVMVLAAGGVLIVVSASSKIVGGMASGLSAGLEERLYEWAKPKKSSPQTNRARAKGRPATNGRQKRQT